MLRRHVSGLGATVEEKPTGTTHRSGVVRFFFARRWLLGGGTACPSAPGFLSLFYRAETAPADEFVLSFVWQPVHYSVAGLAAAFVILATSKECRPPHCFLIHRERRALAFPAGGRTTAATTVSGMENSHVVY